MSDLIIAGREDDFEFLRAESLAYYLMANLPDYHAEVITVTDDKWENYKNQVFENNGWGSRPARDRKLKKPDELPQLIWRKSGELIGNTDDYIKVTRHCYGDYAVSLGLYRAETASRGSQKSADAKSL
ncbi:putative malate dehydrogenase 1B [Blyttiomyces sp. JEL0837]|nr:putative malate dehydrogenase 1B [Blyttiomyces sp. JEL0837]